MNTIPSNARLWLCALVVALLFTPASISVSAQGGRGIHVTPNGFRTPLYGMSQVHDANGHVGAACGPLTAPQVEAARFGRRVSRAMVASSPNAVIPGPEGGATFDVTYTDAEGAGFNGANGATLRRAFEVAVAAWGKVIRAAQPIRIEVSMHPMDDGDNDPLTTLLAIAGPSEFWIHENKAVPSPLMWQILNGRFSNAGGSDITVNINQDANWDFSLNGVATEGRFSFVYTMLHELSHGLGFLDSFDIATGKVMNDPVPFLFDEFVNRGSARRNRMLDHASEERIRDMKSNDLFFNGVNANEASGRSFRPLPMVKLYAPDPYRKGASLAHVDQETYADIRTGLMTPIGFGASTDKIDPLTLAILKDIGYTLVPDAVTTRVR